MKEIYVDICDRKTEKNRRKFKFDIYTQNIPHLPLTGIKKNRVMIHI